MIEALLGGVFRISSLVDREVHQEVGKGNRFHAHARRMPRDAAQRRVASRVGAYAEPAQAPLDPPRERRCVLKHALRVDYMYGVTESQKQIYGRPSHYESDCINADKKAPPIAQPMYLEAYTKIIFRKSEEAIKPLTHLVKADPFFSHIQNAMAVALIVARPEQHELAYQHAAQALALDPSVPQFVVTHVLTDRAQWKLEADGTARMTTYAAERLLAIRHHLIDTSGNAKKLGRLLYLIEKSDADPDFPFIFYDYKKLMKKASLLLTRPLEEDFDVAQRSLVDRIFNLRKKLNEDKSFSEEEARLKQIEEALEAAHKKLNEDKKTSIPLEE